MICTPEVFNFWGAYHFQPYYHLNSKKIRVEILIESTPTHFYSVMPKYESPGANGFGAEILVLRPEAVYIYSERKETRIE